MGRFECGGGENREEDVDNITDLSSDLKSIVERVPC